MKQRIPNFNNFIFEYFVGPRTHKLYKPKEWTFELFIELHNKFFGVDDVSFIEIDDVDRVVSEYTITNLQSDAIEEVRNILEKNGYVKKGSTYIKK